VGEVQAVAEAQADMVGEKVREVLLVGQRVGDAVKESVREGELLVVELSVGVRLPVLQLVAVTEGAKEGLA